MAYTRLKYIESDGTQYIDTGFKPNQNTRIVVDFQGLKWNTNEVCMWMGVSSSPYLMFGKASSSNYRAYFYYNTSEVLFSESTTEEWESRQTLDWNKNIVTWGDASKSVSSSTFQCTDNAYLFAANNRGEAKFITRGCIYGCQIYDNDILIRDYIPAISEKGVCGLWDRVNDVFYTSPNGNNFVGHIEGQELPIGYTKCEYIESNGTQYIDTGVIGHANVKAESEFMLMEGGASIPLGCYSPSRLYMISFDSNTCLRYGYSEWFNTSTKIETGRKYSISVDFASGSQSMMLDGVTIASSSILGRVVNDYNIYAFAYNDGGRAGDFSKIRLYGLKLYQEGVLMRDYIPCQNSEGVYGLYDIANDVFYQSATDSVFTGKWEDDKKLLVSLAEFRRRLMMLASGTADQSTWRGVFIEDTTGKLWEIDKWDGSATFNSVAVISDTHSFGLSSYSTVVGSIVNGYSENGINDYYCRVNGDVRVPVPDLSSAYKDFDGEGNTDSMKSVSNPASLCLSYRFNSGVNGYLIAAGEYKMIEDNLSEINRALKKVGGTIIRLHPSSMEIANNCVGLCTSTKIGYHSITISDGHYQIFFRHATFADAWVRIAGIDVYENVDLYYSSHLTCSVPNGYEYLDFESGSYRETDIRTTVKPACRLLKY